MTVALIALPDHLRARLAAALESESLRPPYGAVGLRAALGSNDGGEAVLLGLSELDRLGIRGPAAAAWIRTAAKARDTVPRPDLVWTGPEVPGLHARDTRQVFDEILGTAERSIWASTYAYYDGQRAFQVLAKRMDEQTTLEVTLLINIGRGNGDTRTRSAIIADFRDKFWGKDWPGERRPRLFYYPKGLEEQPSKRGVLHAKALVKDEKTVFITSANFTEAALERNIELGFKLEDPALALHVIQHYGRLIQKELLLPVPS